MKNHLPFRCCLFLGFFGSLLTSLICPAQELAFPGAQGWASITPGGRDGKIIRVTNLNDKGPGSFLEAVSSNEPRIIVFEVGGTLDLKGSSIKIKSPFLTIAGQTAPSPGITFIDGSIQIETHDVIVQHIRLRVGAARHEKGWQPDGFGTKSAYDVIIDHCSFTWALDENCSASGPRFNGDTLEDWRKNTSHRITLSNNIIAEGLSHATHPYGEHSKGTLIHDNALDIAIVNNLYASNQDRNALFKGGAQGVYVNNYINNPGRFAISYGLVYNEWKGHEPVTGKMTVIGNVLQHGPSSDTNMPLISIRSGPCDIYMEDNIAKKKGGQEAALFDGHRSNLVNEKPVWYTSIKPMRASEVKESIAKNVGARPWDRDPHDKRIIEEMLTGTGKIIDSETEVGGFTSFEPTKKTFIEKEWDLKYMIRK